MEFKHKKSLGQHFLNSDYVPQKMCDAGNLQIRETVLEIGPGTGVLTKELLARGAKVIAIETDIRAVEALQETFSTALNNDRLIIHHHDARTLNPADFGLIKHNYKVIANIPYYLSGHLFRSLLDTDCQPNTLVFLIQKEVAERIARDRKESLLSLSIKLFGDPSYICTIKRGHFTPPPQIDSAIIAITNINHEKLSLTEQELFFQIIHLGFGQRRKQLLGNLTASFSRTTVQAIFTTLDLSQTIRAEDVTLADWLQLTRLLLVTD